MTRVYKFLRERLRKLSKCFTLYISATKMAKLTGISQSSVSKATLRPKGRGFSSLACWRVAPLYNTLLFLLVLLLLSLQNSHLPKKLSSQRNSSSSGISCLITVAVPSLKYCATLAIDSSGVTCQVFINSGLKLSMALFFYCYILKQ